ncbi:MAG TPA: DNA polymerase III subunit beta [Gammaproteobacteria bacterium]|nr:DNA polymerase III subunit beta [Gammaproteobacteria bacterium]
MQLQFQVGPELTDALKTLAAIARPSTMPVLENMLVESAGGQVVGTANDFVNQVRLVLPLEADADGAFTVNAKRLASVMQSLATGRAGSLTVEPDKVVLKSGRTRCVMQTLPADEYPLMDVGDTAHTATLSAAAFYTCMDRTHAAMGVKDVRYYLNGLFTQVEDGRLLTVATDGHRMARYSVEVASDAAFDGILPRDSIKELMKLCKAGGDVTITATTSHYCFEFDGGMTFATKLIDGRFPDYQRVIPPRRESCTIDVAELVQTLNRLCLMASKDGIVMSKAGDEIELSTAGVDLPSQGSDAVNCEGGGDLHAGFNAPYLLDALAPVRADSIIFDYGGSDAAFAIYDPDDDQYLGIVMPVRL